MTKHRKIQIFKALTALLFAVISGCSYEYPVELRGIVRSAKDGSPIAGVEVRLTPGGYGNAFPLVSGPDGTFRVTVRMPDVDFTGGEHWSDSLKGIQRGKSRPRHVQGAKVIRSHDDRRVRRLERANSISKHHFVI